MLRILILLLTIVTATNTNAEDANIYQAEIEIDATASSASLAREKAMTEANRKALYAITNRISATSSTAILDELNDNQILNFIQEVSVLSEKVTDSRYVATLKISINAPVLKSYLSEKNAPIAILPKTHIIIVPIYKENPTSVPLLWEENNLWYQAWSNNQMETGQITMQSVPRNDTNENILSAEKASSLDYSSLGTILRNSKGNEIYVAELTVQSNGIEAVLKSPKQGIINNKTYTNTIPDIFETIINDLKSSILHQLQQQTIHKKQQHHQMTVLFSYNTLQEWLSLQTTLKKISTINKINVDAIGNHRIQITLNFTGETINIQNILSKHGYSLNDKGNFYIIERIN